MARLTWRDTAGPNFASANQAFGMFTDLLGKTTTGLQDTLTNFENRGRDEASKNLLMDIAGIRDTTGYEQVLPELLARYRGTNVSNEVLAALTDRGSALYKEKGLGLANDASVAGTNHTTAQTNRLNTLTPYEARNMRLAGDRSQVELNYLPEKLRSDIDATQAATEGRRLDTQFARDSFNTRLAGLDADVRIKQADAQFRPLQYQSGLDEAEQRIEAGRLGNDLAARTMDSKVAQSKAGASLAESQAAFHPLLSQASLDSSAIGTKIQGIQAEYDEGSLAARIAQAYALANRMGTQAAYEPRLLESSLDTAKVNRQIALGKEGREVKSDQAEDAAAREIARLHRAGIDNGHDLSTLLTPSALETLVLGGQNPSNVLSSAGGMRGQMMTGMGVDRNNENQDIGRRLATIGLQTGATPELFGGTIRRGVANGTFSPEAAEIAMSTFGSQQSLQAQGDPAQVAWDDEFTKDSQGLLAQSGNLADLRRDLKSLDSTLVEQETRITDENFPRYAYGEFANSRDNIMDVAKEYADKFEMDSTAIHASIKNYSDTFGLNPRLTAELLFSRGPEIGRTLLGNPRKQLIVSNWNPHDTQSPHHRIFEAVSKMTPSQRTAAIDSFKTHKENLASVEKIREEMAGLETRNMEIRASLASSGNSATRVAALQSEQARVQRETQVLQNRLSRLFGSVRSYEDGGTLRQ